jgi:hypothetical protein
VLQGEQPSQPHAYHGMGWIMEWGGHNIHVSLMFINYDFLGDLLLNLLSTMPHPSSIGGFQTWS